MHQDFTLHTHTDAFDGRNSVAQMVAQASDLGMSAIGISNHFILHPNIKNTNVYPYAIRGGYESMYNSSFDEIMRKFTVHYQDVERVAASAGLRVLRGMEADFFYGDTWLRDFKRAISILQPDYIIGAAHFIEMNNQLYNVHDIEHAHPDIRNQMLNLYWAKVCDAAKSGLFTWMAHLDLPKKVGAGLSSSWQDREQRAIDTLTAFNTPIEINTSRRFADCFTYPCPRILKMVVSAGLPVLLSDDAHVVGHIGRNFDRAAHLMKMYGIKNHLTLQKTLDFSNKTL